MNNQPQGASLSLDFAGALRYPPPRPDWLALHQEAILEPETPVVDAHHHIWAQDGHRYELDQLLADVGSGHHVVATVLVQAHHAYRQQGPEHLKCVGETDHAEALLRGTNRTGDPPWVCAGIVGFADLLLGERVAEVLEAHLAAAPSRFRGVRHSVARDENFPNGIVLRPAPAQLLADRRYRQGLKTVARYGLSYDAMLYHQQLPELTALAHALPGLPVVLDHFGCVLGVGPYASRREDTFRQWRRDIRELARCQNVSVKLGGMGMVICGARFHERPTPPGSAELAEAWRPYVECCVEAFGADRCMFESNFPVDKGMFSYPVVWNAFKRLCAGASAAERSALLGGTAARTYRLPAAVQKLFNPTSETP